MTRPSALRSRSIFATVVSYLGDCCAQSVVKVRLAVRSSDCSRILMLSRRVLCVYVMPRTLILHDWFVLRYYDGTHTFLDRCLRILLIQGNLPLAAVHLQERLCLVHLLLGRSLSFSRSQLGARHPSLLSLQLVH